MDSSTKPQDTAGPDQKFTGPDQLNAGLFGITFC